MSARLKSCRTTARSCTIQHGLRQRREDEGGRRDLHHRLCTGRTTDGLAAAQPSDPEVAFKIPGGSTLVLQIHYTTTGNEEQSLISVGFRYPQKGVDKISHHFVFGSVSRIAIRLGTRCGGFRRRRRFPRATLLGMFHAHACPARRDMTFITEYPETATRHAYSRSPDFQFRLGSRPLSLCR